MARLFVRKTSVEEERDKEEEYKKWRKEQQEYREYIKEFGINERQYEEDHYENDEWLRLCETL